MIVVFGSINMDLVFNPAHAPAAGETVLLSGYDMLPGGKGANQSVAAARMESETIFIGCVGRDGFATQLLNHMQSENVQTDVTVSALAPTGTAVVIVEPDGENRILVAAGANLESSEKQVPDTLLTDRHTLLMQMEVDAAEVKKLALRAHGRAGRVILNLAPALPIDAETLDHVDVLILNEIETCQLAANFGLQNPEDGEQAAAALAQKHALTCVMTLGSAGAVAFGPDGHIAARTKSFPIDHIVDTTGAGDAFCGTLAAGLDQGMDMDLAMQFACVAGSLACVQKGAMASYATRSVIQAALVTYHKLER